MDRSDVLVNPSGNILEIEKMKLDDERLKGHKIFRLQESIMLTFVDESIEVSVEEAGLSVFFNDDEYEPGFIACFLGSL